MARFYDADQQEASKYNVGDKVWLSFENIKMTQPMKKLDYKWLGPYAINQVISRSAYRLKLPSSFRQIHPVFSVTLLRPYKADLVMECQQCHPPPPPPVIHNGIEDYEVEMILDSQLFHRRIEYLVCWRGYRVEEDEWRPSQDVQGEKQLVDAFHCAHPEAPHL